MVMLLAVAPASVVSALREPASPWHGSSQTPQHRRQTDVEANLRVAIASSDRFVFAW